ncbi:Rrf2 family transcriptional regulator [Candidatus Atribacteria bacterium 1244-E10-H5-B2]|nr:MAG: Rrf2 family transcriptional regulator [Candidatus Atribacteria bacterium 1244-E10-H5-B2]
MKLITRNTDYAVRALCFIAEQKQEVISAGQLVKSLEIPRPFLRKILQSLNKKGLLNSSKGKGGGFTLALPPEKISLMDVMKIFQGPIRLNECKFKKSDCPYIDDCLLKKKIDEIEKEVIAKLKTITIASIIKKEVNVDD